MDFATITQFINGVGFPIFCCVFLLTTMKSTITANTDATNGLRVVVEKLISKLGVDDNE